MDMNLISTIGAKLHPAMVHFPIGLLLAAALFDAGCLVFRRFLWLDRTAAALMTLGESVSAPPTSPVSGPPKLRLPSPALLRVSLPITKISPCSA